MNFEKLKKILFLKKIGNSYGRVLLPHTYGRLKAFKGYINCLVFYLNCLKKPNQKRKIRY